MTAPEINLGFESISGRAPQAAGVPGTVCEESCYDPAPSCESCYDPSPSCDACYDPSPSCESCFDKSDR